MLKITKLEKAKAMAKQLKKEICETECQIVTLTRWMDYANENLCLADEGLEDLHKEKINLRQLINNQIEDIKSSRLRKWSWVKAAVQNNIENFEKIEVYDTLSITGPLRMLSWCLVA